VLDEATATALGELGGAQNQAATNRVHGQVPNQDDPIVDSRFDFKDAISSKELDESS